MWRKRFKTIFLGILYGLGKKSLAEGLNCSVDEAENIIEAVYRSYPKLREYIERQQQYPLENGGYVNTFFGDKLFVEEEWKNYISAKTQYDKNYWEAKIKRLGVNLPIQGGTSTAMSSGFYNDIRVGIREGFVLTSFITVHDSNTCSFPAYRVWDIKSFYDKNFTDFCYDVTGIKLLFDLEVGGTYGSTCSMKQIDKDIIEFKGSGLAIGMILDRLDECPNLVYESDLTREEVKPMLVNHPMRRFILDKGCCMLLDQSKYKIRLTRISY